MEDESFINLKKYGSLCGQAESTHLTYFVRRHWCIDESSTFLRDYSEYESIEGRDEIGIGESMRPDVPVIISFKLCFNLTLEDEYIPECFITRVVSIVQQALADTLCLSNENDNQRICCVLVSDVDVSTGCAIKYIRLHFPYCHVSVKDQTTSLLKKVIELLDKSNSIKLLPLPPRGGHKFSGLVETDLLNKALPLYGSVERKGQLPLKLKHIFSTIDQDVEDVTEYELTLDQVFAPGLHPCYHGLDGVTLSEYLPIFFSIRYAEDSPVSLKVPHIEELPLEEEIRRHKASSVASCNTQSICGNLTRSSVDTRRKYTIEQKRSLSLLTMLGPQRVHERHFWLDVGRSLFTTFYGSRDGLNEWLYWTQAVLAKRRAIDPAEVEYFEEDDQSTSSPSTEPLDRFGKGIPDYLRPDSYEEFKNKYLNELNSENEEKPIFDAYNVDAALSIEKQIDDLWSKFKIFPKTLSVRTIEWYAKLDSPDAYDKWHQKIVNCFLLKALSCTHKAVADLVVEVYGLEFACIGKKKEWYVFRSNGWVECPCGIYLMKIFGTSLVDIVYKYIDNLQKEEFDENAVKRTSHTSSESDTTNDPDGDDSGDEKKVILNRVLDQKRLIIKGCESLIKKLEDIPYCKKILEACSIYMYDDNFEKYKDSNPNAIGVLNGVVETCNGYAVFRAGKPEDYITLRTESLYDPELHWGHPQVVNLLTWIRRIFGDRELLWFSLMLFASWLRGKNYSKLWVVMIGMGNNSKSMLKRLFDMVFGMYSFGLPPSTFTQTKDTSSSACTPELVPCRYAHVAWCTEVSRSLPYRAEVVKRHTGLDEIPVRDLFSGQKSVVPFHHLVTQANAIPYVQGMDEAMEIRLLILPFTALWSVNAPKDIKDQEIHRHYKLNRNFDYYIPHLVSACLWVLIQFYSDFCKYGLAWRPELVKRQAEDFFYKMDPFYRFQRECIRVVPSKPGDKRSNVDVDMKVTVAEMYAHFKDWVNEQGEKNRIMVNRDEFEDRMTKRLRMAPKRNAWYGIEMGTGFDSDVSSDRQEEFAKEQLKSASRYKSHHD